MIETPFKLGERAHHVLLADRPVCGGDRGLGLGEHGVDLAESGVARRPASRNGRQRDVFAASIGNALETLQAVSDDDGPWRDDALGHRLDAGA